MRPRYGVNDPPPYIAEVKERIELYLYSPFEPYMASSRVNFELYLHKTCKILK
jgi:hypothetical protein